jgi:ornithine carbamoyltransferase
LKEIDLSPDEFIGLLDLASALKQAKAAGTEIRHLQDKNIALIFEKASTRTRCAFEVAAYDQGAQTTYLGREGSHLGREGSIEGHRPSPGPLLRRDRVSPSRESDAHHQGGHGRNHG